MNTRKTPPRTSVHSAVRMIQGADSPSHGRQIGVDAFPGAAPGRQRGPSTLLARILASLGVRRAAGTSLLADSAARRAAAGAPPVGSCSKRCGYSDSLDPGNRIQRQAIAHRRIARNQEHLAPAGKTTRRCPTRCVPSVYYSRRREARSRPLGSSPARISCARRSRSSAFASLLSERIDVRRAGAALSTGNTRRLRSRPARASDPRPIASPAPE